LKTTQLVVLLFLLSAVLCTSCNQQLVKPAAVPANIPAIADSTEIENLVNQAFQLYQQGRLGEAIQKLEDATSKITEYTPKSTVTTLFTFLAFFQEKSGDSEKAVATFKLVKGFFQGLRTMPNESEALANKLIQIASRLNIQDRLQLLERLRPIASASHGEAGEAAVIWKIAEAYFELHAFQEAIQHASRAAEMYNRLRNRIQGARNLRIVGQSLAELNKVDEALQVLQKATDIQVDEKNLDEASETYWWTIGFLKRLGRIEDVKQSLLTALDANANIFGKKEVEAKIRAELANVNRDLGLYSEALEQFDIALTLQKELSDKKEQINILLQKVKIYAYLNDQENEIVALDLAEQLGAGLDDSHIKFMILNNTAEFYFDLGDIVEALQRYLEALETSRLISKQAESSQIAIIGIFYSRIGEYDKALNYFDKGLNLAKEVGNQTLVAVYFNLIGLAYYSMGQYENAIHASREGLEILRSGSADKSAEDFCLEVVGLTLMAQGNYDTALNVQQERLQFRQESGNLSHIQNVYRELGKVFLKMEKYSEAIEAFKKAIERIEFLRGGFRYDEHKMGFFEKELSIINVGLSPYDGIIDAFYNLYFAGCPEKNRLAEEALHFAELSKARTWSEQLSKARLRFVQESIPIKVRKKEEEILSQTSSVYAAYTSASTLYRISEGELNEKGKAWEGGLEKLNTFVEELRRRYPKYAALRYPETSRLSEWAIRDGETLVVYKVGIDWTYAWVIRSIGGHNKIIKFARLPVRTDDIIKLTEKVLTPFRKVKYEKFEPEVASELFRTILFPLMEGVGFPKRLIIVPDGILNVVPFEALIIGPADDKGLQAPLFLQDKFLISYYPSATILTINRQTVPLTLPSKDTLLAVGDPVYGLEDERLTKSQVSKLLEGEQKQESSIVTRKGKIRKEAQDQGYSFVRLKYSGVEVVKIKEVFVNRPGPRDLLIGSEATESHVKSKDLMQYQYLHFAVHGILAYDVPYLKEPALVLAVDPESKEDGFLTLSEIYGLKLNADLVTLSACKTGLGQRIPGEGVIGLSRAFIDAGSQAVLVSLWEVDDHSTALFMEEFYRLLAQGVNKVEALAKAKDYLRQKGYENPYFWAPFILIGD